MAEIWPKKNSKNPEKNSGKTKYEKKLNYRNSWKFSILGKKNWNSIKKNSKNSWNFSRAIIIISDLNLAWKSPKKPRKF